MKTPIKKPPSKQYLKGREQAKQRISKQDPSGYLLPGTLCTYHKSNDPTRQQTDLIDGDIITIIGISVIRERHYVVKRHNHSNPRISLAHMNDVTVLLDCDV